MPPAILMKVLFGQRTRQRYDYRRFRSYDDEKQLNHQSTWGIQKSDSGQPSNRRGNTSGNMDTRWHDPNYVSNTTEEDRNCMIHCFFREMKMVN